MDLMRAVLADLYPSSAAPESTVHEDRYEVALDVPGYTPEDFSVEADAGVLTIKGNSERRGKFTRRYTLPRTVNSDGITADLEHGVLTVVIPKAETAKAKKIRVLSGKASLGPPELESAQTAA